MILVSGFINARDAYHIYQEILAKNWREIKNHLPEVCVSG